MSEQPSPPLAAIRQADAFDIREDADAAMLAYAAMLRARGETARFGVFVQPFVGGGFGVFLLDRAIAPARPPRKTRQRKSSEVISNLDEQGYLRR